MDAEVIGNSEAIEAWNGVLFDRFVEFRDIVCTGLGIHGAAALELYPVEPGQRVLDIGCGFGDETRRIAGLVAPGGEVVGVDAAARFVEAGSEEAAAQGVPNARFEVADVQDGVPGSGYDRVFSRMGTMFFENPVAAFRNVRAAMRPGALLTMVVWRQKAENVLFFEAERIAERWLTHPDRSDEPTCGPGPFSMANADTTSGILRSAGFDRITLTRSDAEMRQGGSVEEFVDFITAIGPAGELIRVNEDEGERLRPQIERALREELASYQRADGVYAPTSAWIVAARNPD